MFTCKNLEIRNESARFCLIVLNFHQDHYLPAYGMTMAFAFQVLSFCAIGAIVELSV